MKLKRILFFSVIALLFLALSLRVASQFLISKDPITHPPEDNVRIGFFADPHFKNEEGGVQADIGRASLEIPLNTKVAINSFNPDYIFCLGDLTAYSQPEEWEAYENWINELNAPVFDLLGNHDRDYSVFSEDNYGREYFTELGRVSDTTAWKMGNNVFILISEEHDYEGDGNDLSSVIPDKRFDFIEEQLKKYSDSNNVFILSHSPLTGITAFSETWFNGRSESWIGITRKYLEMFEDYPVIAHISGHIHMDYRTIDRPNDHDGNRGAENVGKFVYGPDIDNTKIKYHPGQLPDMYFLNMPCVDIAHGLFDILHSWLVRSGVGVLVPIRNLISHKAEGAAALKLFMRLDGFGLPFVDMFHNPVTSYFMGRSAVYYVDFGKGDESVDIITRWVGANKDVERYSLNLSHPVELGDREMEFVDSDLSLRSKDNLIITVNDWFKIKNNTVARGEFSKRYPEKILINGLSIEGQTPGIYSVKWKGSEDGGKTWSESWYNDPKDLGEVDAILLKINFESLPDKDWYVRDVVIETE